MLASLHSRPVRGGDSVMYTESLLPTLESLARRAAEPEGLQVAWIELKRQGGSFVFRVFIDREEGGVGIVDCERVSERLSLLLDVEDPIDASYTLEVSTPGLDRPLRNEQDYQRFEGHRARIKTHRAYEGRRRFQGRLAGVRSGAVLVEERDGEATSIPLNLIESGRLEVEFGPPIRDSSRSRGKKSQKSRKRA